MIINIVLVLAILVVGVLIVAATRPTDFRCARSVAISAPLPAIFSEVNDYHKWTAWSPYEKYDPGMKRAYSGAPAGAGAIYDWTGNMKAGTGRATIIESRPGEVIRIKLEFKKPMACTNDAEFRFQPQGSQTLVTWSLAGKNTLMGKVVGLFVNMDKMVGGQFEEGLASLKAISEHGVAK